MWLLSGYEPPSPSLPTDCQPSERRFPVLWGPFCSGKSEAIILSVPLSPPARFLLWVKLWVKHSMRHTPYRVDSSEFHRPLRGGFRAVFVKGDGHGSGPLQLLQFFRRKSQLVYELSCRINCACHNKHLFQNWWPAVRKLAE